MEAPHVDEPVANTDSPRASFGGRLEVAIDVDMCMGSQNCVMEANSIFELDDRGVSRVKRDVDANDLAILQRVVELCPSAALSIKAGFHGGTEQTATE